MPNQLGNLDIYLCLTKRLTSVMLKSKKNFFKNLLFLLIINRRKYADNTIIIKLSINFLYVNKIKKKSNKIFRLFVNAFMSRFINT